MCLSLHVSA
ncbi:hypothetical protein L4F31_20330 [Vibrio paracholerae]|nr:hypothetical protein [Vibrio paracholerae]MCO7025467.1 hypothetical protein [Vibrio paracholerae]MCO7028159.1 hypothetical protein [Vibrio paracholerae]MCO7034514.1 hypothetical protein [Vibrio paracholerae]MCO7047994.1 hypothetical protein [Vibrio paracholerae]